jgi:arylsulfatase A-like enzyme
MPVKPKSTYSSSLPSFFWTMAIACLCSGAAAQQKPTSPNIIFILVDDQGYGDLGSFFQKSRLQSANAGKPVEFSPSLDKLAGEGAMLTQYYCAAPICAPSRASLILGVSQGHANVRDNQFDKALDDNYTMASTLRSLGYSTAAIGKWGLEGNDKYDLNGYLWPAHPLKRGFDYFFGYMRHADGHEHYPKEALYRKYWAENSKAVWQNETNITQKLDKCYTADLWTAAAKKYIVDHIRGSEKAKPFLLYLAYDTPHAVLELPTGKYPAGGGLHGGIRWLGTPGHFINTAEGKPDSYVYPEYAGATYDDDGNPATPEIPWPDTYKRYATANRRIDDAVGDLVQLLKDLKIDSNTIIVYTSDNGPSDQSYLPEDNFVPNHPTFFESYGPFEGIKADTWEGGIHLPAIVRWPGKIPAGKKLDIPVIAYDWAPTFIDIAGQPVPQHMDGVSILPSLTGKGKQQEPLVYIEYKGDDSTPAYKEFAPEKRGRIRGQMQVLRLGNLAGVRYNIQSADDDFEIYDLVKDPAQHHNLALDGNRKVQWSPVLTSFNGNTIKSTDIKTLQAYMKDRVLQVRLAGNGSPRPYDSALIAPVVNKNVTAGMEWKTYSGKFKWIPKTANLQTTASGFAAFPNLNPEEKGINTLTVFEGFIKVPDDGEYTFYMSCDAKAFLRIHDIQVIDEDYGYPGNLIRSTSLFLKAGLHPFSLSYYRTEDRGPAFLKLDWSGPGVHRQRMGKDVFFREQSAKQKAGLWIKNGSK